MKVLLRGSPMGIVTQFYEKYLMARGESLETSNEINKAFLHKIFICGSYECVALTVLSNIVVYLSLKTLPHDDMLNYWFICVMIFFVQRILVSMTFKDGGAYLFFVWVKEITQELIALMIFTLGVLWLALLAIVFFNPVYTVHSKLLVSGFLLLYTSGALSIYAIMPIWGTVFVPTVFIPIALTLFSYGWFGIIYGLMILGYTFALLGLSYRSYHTQFQSIYQKYEIEKLAHQLDKLARTDKLTGVTNRVYLDEIMGFALKNAQRNNSKVAILYFDFDRFKYINDTYGHHVGDELLKGIAQRFKKFIRETDEIFRIGGDEFLLMITNIHSRKSVEKFAQDILILLEKPYNLDGHEIVSNASIGISLYPDNNNIPDILVTQADEAMYIAKSQGGRNFVFFDSIPEDLKKKTIGVLSSQPKAKRTRKRNSRTSQIEPEIPSPEMLNAEESPKKTEGFKKKIDIPDCDGCNLVVDLEGE